MKHLLIATIEVTSLLATTTVADPIHDAARKGDIEAVEERLNFLTTLFLVIAEKYNYFYPHDGFVVRGKGLGGKSTEPGCIPFRSSKRDWVDPQAPR